MRLRLWFCVWVGLYLALGFTLLLSQRLHAQSVTMRDPTRPEVSEMTSADLTKKKEEEPYIVQSIIVSQSRRIALINNKYFSVGDMLGEDTVIAIENNKVVLSRPNQKTTVYLFDLRPLE